MSVSRGGSETTYQDLHTMQVEQTARFVDAPADAGANKQLEEIDLQRSDTLSLGHDEMAELVGLDLRNYRMYVDDNDYSNTYNARGAMSIAVNFDDMQWIRSNDLETDNIGTSGELSGRTRLDDDSRLLWWGTTTFDVGGSSDWNPGGENYPTFIDYRGRFGQGPLLDSNDSITHGSFIRTVATTGAQNLVQIVDWTGYFDIFEVENIRR